MQMWCHENEQNLSTAPTFLDSIIQVDPSQKANKVHAVGSGDMSHGRVPAFCDLDHRIVIFKNEKRCPVTKDVCVWRNKIDAV